MDAVSKQIEASEIWVPFVPMDGVLLNSARPNDAEQSGGKEEDATDGKHWVMANVIEEPHRSNAAEISHGRVSWQGYSRSLPLGALASSIGYESP